MTSAVKMESGLSLKAQSLRGEIECTDEIKSNSNDKPMKVKNPKVDRYNSFFYLE